MARRRIARSSESKTNIPPAEASLLDGLASDEANAVLDGLLKRHPALREEAEKIARDIVSTLTAEDIADDVFHTVIGFGLDALNQRAGSHSWGYVEPSEAALEILEESLEHLIDDMKRQAELGLAAGAEAICVGMVEGLYRARDAKSDGALGWAPDFPAEHACYVLGKFFQSCATPATLTTRKRLLEALVTRAPEWADMLRLVKSD